MRSERASASQLFSSRYAGCKGAWMLKQAVRLGAVRDRHTLNTDELRFAPSNALDGDEDEDEEDGEDREPLGGASLV